MKNIDYSVKQVVSTLKNAGSETITGAAIDTMGFDDIELLGASGAATGSPTGQTLNVKLQHSDTTTSGDFSDITGAAIAEITADNTTKRVKVANAYMKKRYVRTVTVVALTAGTSPALPVLAEVVLGRAHAEPISQ